MKLKKPKKETLGEVATRISQKQPDSRNPIEIQQHIRSDAKYMKDLHKAIDKGKKLFPQKDFYVIDILKEEALFSNVFRDFFFPRLTCPTPNYDETVYKFFHKEEEILWIWTIPDRGTCHYLLEHAKEVAPEERELLFMVMKYADGSLYRLMKQLNGEAPTSTDLIKEQHD